MAIRTVCLHDEVAKQLADFGRQSSQRIVIDHRGCERRHCPVDQNSRRDRQLMSQCNELDDDMPIVEGNLTTGHVVTLARSEAVRPIAPMRPTLHGVGRERTGVIGVFVKLVAAASSG